MKKRKCNLRIYSEIAYYLKNKNISHIFNTRKVPIMATGGMRNRINIFSNCWEHMGCSEGHKGSIWCLLYKYDRIGDNQIIISGSGDKSIKIWDLEQLVILRTLNGHKDWVNALCEEASSERLISGSLDKCIIVWGIEGDCTSVKHILKGSTSPIEGLIYMNNNHLLSGETKGHLRLWDIAFGVCLIYINSPSHHDGNLRQIKLIQMNVNMNLLCCSMGYMLILWDGVHWEAPRNIFRYSHSSLAIGYLGCGIFIRGRGKGEISFISSSTGKCLGVMMLHSDVIRDILIFAKNIVITISNDAYVKVTDIISNISYFSFKDEMVFAITLLY